MGKTFADFYRATGKPANMKIALGVRAREFIELFYAPFFCLRRSSQPVNASPAKPPRVS